ncbi:hypothetical protein FB451DRAFT_1408994 [Mycena latifolia]|nr:hypothetical protein FB451DRAFT_1408994 [Mycena latifolia]
MPLRWARRGYVSDGDYTAPDEQRVAHDVQAKKRPKGKMALAPRRAAGCARGTNDEGRRGRTAVRGGSATASSCMPEASAHRIHFTVAPGEDSLVTRYRSCYALARSDLRIKRRGYAANNGGARRDVRSDLSKTQVLLLGPRRREDRALKSGEVGELLNGGRMEGSTTEGDASQTSEVYTTGRPHRAACASSRQRAARASRALNADVVAVWKRACEMTAHYALTRGLGHRDHEPLRAGANSIADHAAESRVNTQGQGPASTAWRRNAGGGDMRYPVRAPGSERNDGETAEVSSAPS